MQGVGGSSPLILTKNPVLVRGRDFYFLPIHYSLLTNSYLIEFLVKVISNSEEVISVGGTPAPDFYYLTNY